MAVSRRAFGNVLKGLRAIREASAEDVIEAMRERISSLDLAVSGRQPAFELLTPEQLHRLERSEELETNVTNLFLLAETLGVSIGHVFWFVDLILPRDGDSKKTPEKQVAVSLDSASAWDQYIRRVEEASQKTMSITESEANELYGTTGLVSDDKIRDILLRRFLRKPFPADRYQIGIVGRKDHDMSPILEPGTLLLIDTVKEILATSGLCPLNPFYWGIHRGKHQCIWPHSRDGIIVYMTMASDGTWSEIQDALVLGVPLFPYWQLNPLAIKDFYVADFRDHETELFIRAVRTEHDEGLVH